MKDHATFLEAAAHVTRERPDVRFLCVGPGSDAYTGELRDLADRLGLTDRVIWAGARNDMPAVYNALDVLTLTSCFGEGFPNVIGEAMATGVPCVVTDVGDSAWVVGNLGTVVPVRTPETLAPALLEMLHKTDTGQIDRSALRNSVVERFSVDAVTAKTESALAELLE